MKKSTKRTKGPKRRQELLVFAVALLSLTLLLVLADQQLHLRLSRVIDSDVLGLQQGDIATEDIVAKKSISYIDYAATELLQEEARSSVLPLFRVSLTRSMQSLELLRSLKDVILDESLSVDEKIGLLDRTNTDELFSGNELSVLFTYSPQELRYMFAFTEELLLSAFQTGIYSPQSVAESGSGNMIRLLRIDNQAQEKVREVSIEELFTLESLKPFLEAELGTSETILGELRGTIRSLVLALAVENIIYDPIHTERDRQSALQSVVPVVRSISDGELIIKEGFLVTEEDLQKVKALERIEISQKNSERLGRALYYLFLVSSTLILLRRRIAHTSRRTQYIYLALLCLLFYVLSSALLVGWLFDMGFSSPVYIAPLSLFSMLLTIIIGQGSALIFSGFAALAILFVPEIQLSQAVYLFVMGTVSSLVLSQAKRRIDLVRSAGLSFVIGSLSAVLTEVIITQEVQLVLTAGALSAVSTLAGAVIVIILLPVLEHVMNLPTVFRLIELTTMNSKTLKRMAVMARGTYSHSVAVADLSETACEAIGANHLLARVGAYYHDIGKIDQPEYFIENQAGDNKHDELKPSLSVVVIKSHVKVGIEKAKAIGLPQEVIDIIAQHHGSDVISYFYREALMNNDKGSKISPEDFSYNGVPPMSKEAAVVMLADSVDAASRTLKQPTTTKLDKLIWKIITDKIEHKQLIYSDLSLRELEVIKNSFIMILTGRFHTRIEYPQMPTGAER